MRRRTVLVICCALVFVFAGCSSGSRPEQPAETLTPMETPEIPTEATPTDEPLPTDITPIYTELQTPPPEPTPTARPGATFEGVAMPPGTDKRGVVNVEALARANADALSQTDYVIEYEDRSEIWENGTLVSGRTGTVTVRAGTTGPLSFRTRASDLLNGEGRNRTIQGYVVDGVEYTRLELENVTYRTDSLSRTKLERSFSKYTLGRRLSYDGWEPTGTTVVHGRAAIVFELQPVVENERASVSGRMVVDTRGLVHSLEYRADYEQPDGDDQLMIFDYELDPTGDVTIEEPSWLGEAKNATQDSDGPGVETATTVSG